LTAWAEHPYRLLDDLLPILLILDVVDSDIRNHQIEAVVFEWQLDHITGLQLDTVGDAFCDSISKGCFDGIPRLISPLPEIDTDGSARRQMLGGHQQYGAPTTSDVQDSLIAVQVKLVKQFSPDSEFAATRRVKPAAHAQHHENASAE